MTSRIDDELVNSIVAGVLDRLRGNSAPGAGKSSEGRQPTGNASTAAAAAAGEPVTVTDRVVTESLLDTRLNGARAVRFDPKAIITPTARDFLRNNKIDWAFAAPPRDGVNANRAGSWAALVVASTPVVERVVADALPGARTELLGCPDDAAALVIAEIARGGFSQAVIFAEQTHRAACLANRHASVKAVAVRDASDVVAIRKQLRANVWCIDPTERRYFELRNILKALQS